PEPPPEDTESRHTAWYHEPIDNGARWDEPFLAAYIGKVLVEYGVPFYFTNNPDKPAGMVSINYSLQTMRDLVSSLELGETGYGFVVSTDGTYLTHPVRELVTSSTIFDSVGEQDSALRSGAQQALNGESVMIDGIDPITQDGSWTFFEPLPVTGWALGVVMNKNEFMADPHETLRQQVTIALSGAVFIVLATAVTLRVDQVTNRSLWIVSGVFSLLCIVLIVVVCFLATTLERRVGVQVVEDSAVQSYLEDYTNPAPSETQVSAPPIIIPTGIYVQTVEFPNPTSVSLTGYIWQRYPADLDENIVRGFTLPQVSSSGYMLDEIQRQEQNGSELIVWNFSFNLRQAFNPEWFPFDTRDITVRIAPRDLSQNIIFTPDFDAYDLMNPRLLPGVDPTVNVNNWRLESSSYSYQLDSYNTSFGLTNQAQIGHAPEMAFTLNTQRSFLGPFIAYLLPGIVIALMLFAFLLYEGKPGEPVQIMTALNYTAALFFVIAITHTGLRSSIGAVGITYMENLYILLYVVIIIIAVNTFLLSNRPNIFIVSFRHNLLIKVLYWPLFIGVMLIATLLIFVYS
ncbi:MAG: hypothetical protein H7175_07560, partial [Burkholderiales bacterium]|nr:hypothetical protein [Anaerolineae bacterium]